MLLFDDWSLRILITVAFTASADAWASNGPSIVDTFDRSLCFFLGLLGERSVSNASRPDPPYASYPSVSSG